MGLICFVVAPDVRFSLSASAVAKTEEKVAPNKRLLYPPKAAKPQEKVVQNERLLYPPK